MGISQQNVENHVLEIINYQYPNGSSESASEFEVRPRYFRKMKLNSTKKLLKDDVIDRDKLHVSIGVDMSKQYIAEKKEFKKKIYLDNDLFDEIKGVLEKNAEPFKKGTYHIYISFLGKGKEPLWHKAYRFEIYDYMVNAFTMYQLQSYKLPQQYDNQFMRFYISTKLTEEKDEAIVDELEEIF